MKVIAQQLTMAMLVIAFVTEQHATLG